MIVSVHIRKAAGSSFRTALKEYYGDYLLLDYGDEIGSSSVSSRIKRFKRKLAMRADSDGIVERYKIVHGHFFADKYRSLKTPLEYATFLRDPVDRVLSNYYYLKRNPGRKHGDAVVIKKYQFTLEQYVAFPDARDVQCQFLSGIPLSSFAFVGLAEAYDESIKIFNQIFSADLGFAHNENRNPERERQYDVDDGVAELIRKHNRRDLELYEEAKGIFHRQRNRYLFT
ncbi:MAG: hypothetical protein APF80_10965 [Alphaproteobacteria bacterium BRH_c36]|nr:MAG: hypothetical protein APF80_10965 [Alphaproteobacteria bacterium BRH_c36]